MLLKDSFHMNPSLLTELGAALVAGNLTDKTLLARTGETPNLQILPQANVIKIGGQSFIDRGRSAVYPLIREIKQDPAFADRFLSDDNG